MDCSYEALSQTVRTWRERDDLSARQLEIARTIWHMAARLKRGVPADIAAEKALKVVGCHLCRQLGEAVCGSSARSGDPCPLGFGPGNRHGLQ